MDRNAPGVPQVAENAVPLQQRPLDVSWISVSSAQMFLLEPAAQLPGPPDIEHDVSLPVPGPEVGRSKAFVMIKGRLKPVCDEYQTLLKLVVGDTSVELGAWTSQWKIALSAVV